MFSYAHKIAQIEKFVVQKYDKAVFYSGQNKDGESLWTSDKIKAKQFSTILAAINEAREINLKKIIVLRDLNQIFEVEIEEPIVAE